MDALERINLNIPSDARRRLRQVAKRMGHNESEVARTLLLKALDDAEKADFYRAANEAQTPAHRERQLEILRAFERVRVRGKTR